MFSAISSYFFGSDRTPPAETPVEYDIKEDEEWMLVDVSGNKENITEAICEKDENIISCDSIDEEINDDCSEDDYQEDMFECVSHFPVLKEQECLFLNVNHPTHLSLSSSWTIPSISCLTDCSQCFLNTDSSLPKLNKNEIVNFRRDIALQQHRLRFMARTLLGLKGANNNINDFMSVAAPPDLLGEIIVPFQPDAKNTTAVVIPRSEARVFQLRRTPLEQKPAIKLPKKEYMQQIQELIPSQQAKEYQSKKYIKKAQLNRKNRVCMYESSNKNRHRRDLLQHHSGANNNRKCY